MTNENKNINELVADDDDPTSELEILPVLVPEDIELETAATTSGLRNAAAESGSTSITGLQSALQSRTGKTGQLEFEIEQLRARLQGLDAEVSAREKITKKLNQDIDELYKELSHKSQLVKGREETIKSLTAEIRERYEAELALQRTADDLRDELERARLAERELDFDGLKQTLAQRDETILKLERDNATLTQRAVTAEAERVLDDRELIARQNGLLASNKTLIKQLQEQLARSEQYADSLRYQLQDALAVAASAEESRQALQQSLCDESAQLAELRAQLQSESDNNAELEQQLHDALAAAAAAEEIRGQLQQSLDDESTQLEELRSQLHVESSKNAELDQQLQDALATATAAEETRNQLQQSLDDACTESAELKTELHDYSGKKAELEQQLQEQLARSEEHVESLRQQLQDAQAMVAVAEETRDRLQESIDSESRKSSDLDSQLQNETRSIAELEQRLEEQRNAHDEEIRTLRFELSEAQETATQHVLTTEQLASDLIENRGVRIELESMLSRAEEESKAKIEKLENKNRKMQHTLEELEEKIETKNESINCLLSELAKKSQPMDSISDIEHVIQGIDERVSERVEERLPQEKDRVTRVLVGSVEGQELRFPLFKDRLTVGRTEQNDIQLKAPYISRRHAVIVTDGDRTRIIDWGSKNGVFVNSARITEHFLGNGDIVAIGTATFRYEERPKRDS